MEVHLSRDEILRQVRASLGVQTDATLGSQVGEQHIVAINQAALTVMQACAWVSSQARDTVTLGKEQDTLNYPDGCGPGSVRAMAVYDDQGQRYYPLDPRIIPVHADHDIQQAAGGDTFKSVLGRPRYFEQRGQIKLWPHSDREYKIRLDFVRSAIMPSPNSVSIVDAMLIIYMATALIATQTNDERMATAYAGPPGALGRGGLYGDRLTALKAWQSQGSTFAMSSEADLGEDEAFDANLIPNWDRRPTMTPFNAPAS